MDSTLTTTLNTSMLRTFLRRLHLHRREVACAGDETVPPLVILHGLFGSSSNFATVSRALNTRRRVVLCDLRNHGSSTWSEDASIEAMADDVIELMDEMSICQAAVCGHSLGGKVAMAAALARPERITSLIVADILPVTHTEAHEGWRTNVEIMEVLASLPDSALGSRADADAALAARAVGDPGVRAFLLQNLVAGERRFRMNVHGLLASAKAGELSAFPEHLPPTKPISAPTEHSRAPLRCKRYNMGAPTSKHKDESSKDMPRNR